MAKNGWKDLVGTMFDYFRIGFTGVRLKNSAGVLEVRNAGDTADAPVKGYDRVNQESFTQATASPLTIVTPNNGEVVQQVIIDITAAAAGGSPTLAVGVTGTVGAYMATTENNVKEVGVYDVQPMITNTGQAIILTIVPNAQTFSGTVTVKTGLPG